MKIATTKPTRAPTDLAKIIAKKESKIVKKQESFCFRIYPIIFFFNKFSKINREKLFALFMRRKYRSQQNP